MCWSVDLSKLYLPNFFLNNVINESFCSTTLLISFQLKNRNPKQKDQSILIADFGEINKKIGFYIFVKFS